MATSGEDRDSRPERKRVRDVYDGYARDPYYKDIWSDTRASRFMLESKWARIRKLLSFERVDLGSCRALDLGAGDGGDSARLAEAGVRADRIVAIDLLENRAHGARQTHPWMMLVVGDACHLPFRDASFDLVYQSTMISSVLSHDLRAGIAREIGRVLSPGGMFISYDTRYPNPWNRNTRPLRGAELRRLFAGWQVKVWSVTAIPQIIRVLARGSLAACRLVEMLPPLRSHLLALARKP